MAGRSPPLLTIAATGGELADFGPYVAAINGAGLVAFRATLRSGGSGLFLGEGGALAALDCPAGELIGHPAINDAGTVSFLSSAPPEAPRLWLRPPGGGPARAHHAPEIVEMGPRGPVMNGAGCALFCARLRTGEQAIYAAEAGALRRIAVANARLRAFPGLPVVNRAGDAVFAADLASGGRTILLQRGETLTTVAETGGEFAELSAFPSLDDSGRVAFTARLSSDVTGVFLWTGGETRALADGSGPFESFRSVLLHGESGLILCATPRGGRLGVYRGADPGAPRILGLGDAFEGSTVADFALNAVSVNAAGQLALRLRLENGRQLILRAEPSAP